MNDDFVQAAKNRAKLQQQMQQLSEQEQKLQNDINRLKTETPKLEKRHKLLKDRMGKNPANTLEERQAFHKDRLESEGLASQIETNRQALPQKQADLEKLQTQDNAKLLGENIKQQGMEASYKGHTLAPGASPLRKGGTQNQFITPMASSKMPEDQTQKLTDNKEFKDWNDKGNQAKTPNSPIAESTKEKAKDAVKKDSKEQDQNKGQGKDDDNVR